MTLIPNGMAPGEGLEAGKALFGDTGLLIGRRGIPESFGKKEHLQNGCTFQIYYMFLGHEITD